MASLFSSVRSGGLQKAADGAWSKMDKINSELFTITYGAIVTQLIKDIESVDEVNVQLEKMGYNIGMRLIDEFLARSGLPRCKDLKETSEVIAKVAFKMFLGIPGTVSKFDAKKQSFRIALEENPLIEFVELPAHLADKLQYSNLLCGVIRGALEMVQMKVECTITKEPLRSTADDVTEIKVKLIEILTSEIPVGDE